MCLRRPKVDCVTREDNVRKKWGCCQGSKRIIQGDWNLPETPCFCVPQLVPAQLLPHAPPPMVQLWWLGDLLAVFSELVISGENGAFHFLLKDRLPISNCFSSCHSLHSGQFLHSQFFPTSFGHLCDPFLSLHCEHFSRECQHFLPSSILSPTSL